MVSSGLEELDTRLGGGLAEGRFYMLGGAPGSGKTMACVHFLGEALAAGETCALLTQENPEDLVAQAEFAGYDFVAAEQDGRLAVLQYRLDFAQNYSRVARPERVADEFVRQMEGVQPARIVIDTILPLLDAGGGPHGAVHALMHLMERFAATAYFTLPGDVSDSYYARAYDTITSGAAGILAFSTQADGSRRVDIRKCRTATEDGTPLLFSLRAGAGLVPYRAGVAPGPDEQHARRVVLLDPQGSVTAELESVLQQDYEMARYDSLENAFGELASGSFGVLLIYLNVRDSDRIFDFVRSLRNSGSGAPILFLSPAQGLRGSTRARGLRAGADDFISEDISPHELQARVEAARRRGHQPTPAQSSADVRLLQPRDESGTPMPMDDAELAAAIRRHLKESSHPFFALVEIDARPELAQQVWERLHQGLRLGDGDLIARSGRHCFTMYLPDVSRRRVEELLARTLADEAVSIRDQTVYGYPADRESIEHWLARAERARRVESA